MFKGRNYKRSERVFSTNNLMQNGNFSSLDNLANSSIVLSNPKYIEIDNTFGCTISIVNYPHSVNDLILNKILDLDMNYRISIFYERLDSAKAIKEISYNIGNVKVGIDDSFVNDKEIAAFTYNDALYIRKELQLGNQQLYYIYMYITVFAIDVKKLEHDLSRLQGILETVGLTPRRLDFRQLEGFFSTLPLSINSELIKNTARRNVLTDGLVATYPFVSSSLFEESGIMYGINTQDNSMVFIDRFIEKNNANMVVFGTSGAGKSFFTKLQILRTYLEDITQFIVDIENEYVNLAKRFNGSVIRIGPKSNTFINIMEIRENSLEEGEEGYLATKINKLVGFFSLVFQNLTIEEKSSIEKALINTYSKYNITFNDNSLFENGQFKKEMPVLRDVYDEFNKRKSTKHFALKLYPYVFGSMKYFNHSTNVDINNKLVVANIYDLDEESTKIAMFIFIDIFWDLIKKNRNEHKVLYLDEVWKLISASSSAEVATFIFKIFKTIRKYGGSAVAITQDIYDLFSLKNGAFGRSILNNSAIKCFFKLEEENLSSLEKIVSINEIEKREIKSLQKGELFLKLDDKRLKIKVDASQYEKEIIEED